MHTGSLAKLIGLSTLICLLTMNQAWAAKTLEYNIRWSTDDDRYHVFMRPTLTPDPDANMTGQVTIRVPHATGAQLFQVSGLTSTVNNAYWAADSRANAPGENPDFDYISLTLNVSNGGDFNWQAGEEVEVFHFANPGPCIGPVEIMANNDPFVTPVNAGGNNSAGTNPGNQFSNLGWNDNPGENNFLGIYGSPADCSDSLDTDSDGIVNGVEKLLGTDPEDADTDNDGLSDAAEINGPDGNPATTADNTDPLDADSDDDGLSDGAELNGPDNNPITTADNTDPNHEDSDLDGLQDGTELGKTTPIASGQSDGSTPVAYTGTVPADFIADMHPGSTTDPNNPDTDAGGDCDGNLTVIGICKAGEDVNHNGRIDDGETDPNIASDDSGQSVRVQLRVILQGPYNPTLNLMNDHLRTQGYLPSDQPYNTQPTQYAGTEQLAVSIAQLTGNNAVVDWVLAELRDPTNPTLLIASKAMLVQRDGDIVDSQSGDNTWIVEGVTAGNYYIALRHRNHLDLITTTAHALSSTATLVDFSQTTTPVKGINTRFESQNTALMYAGDAGFDQRNIAFGPNQDITNLLSDVLTTPGNQDFSANYIMYGYQSSDLNMDGKTIYAGPDNDTNILLQNALLHPDNDTFSANYIINGSMAVQNMQ